MDAWKMKNGLSARTIEDPALEQVAAEELAVLLYGRIKTSHQYKDMTEREKYNKNSVK